MGEQRLRRCPACEGVQDVGDEGMCDSCGVGWPLAKWDAQTREFPLLDEEIRGGVCPRCGSRVAVRLDNEDGGHWLNVFGLLVIWAGWGTASAVAPPVKVFAVVLLAVTLLQVALFVRDYLRMRGATYRGLPALTCTSCDHFRVVYVPSEFADIAGRVRTAALAAFERRAGWLAWLTLLGLGLWIASSPVSPAYTRLGAAATGCAAFLAGLALWMRAAFFPSPDRKLSELMLGVFGSRTPDAISAEALHAFQSSVRTSSATR